MHDAQDLWTHVLIQAGRGTYRSGHFSVFAPSCWNSVRRAGPPPSPEALIAAANAALPPGPHPNSWSLPPEPFGPGAYAGFVQSAHHISLLVQRNVRPDLGAQGRAQTQSVARLMGASPALQNAGAETEAAAKRYALSLLLHLAHSRTRAFGGPDMVVPLGWPVPRLIKALPGWTKGAFEPLPKTRRPACACGPLAVFSRGPYRGVLNWPRGPSAHDALGVATAIGILTSSIEDTAP